MADVVLVDTSVWVKHLRENDHTLAELLEQGEVACHPFIIGELACGGIKNRHEIIGLLNDLPATVLIDHDEIMEFVEYRKLMNRGIGYVDVHLLASALISDTLLWTLDKALRKVGSELSIAFQK